MIEQQLNILGAFLADEFRKELEEQGHRATGDLIDTIRHEVTRKGNSYTIEILGLDYAKYVDAGLKKGTWVSVKALIDWVEVKGIASGEREIKNAAFAIRQKIYQEGSPTKGAFAFSNNGRRKNFISAVVGAQEKKILKELFELFNTEILLNINQMLKQNRKVFNAA